MQFSIKELGKIITGNTPSKTKEEYWNSSDIYFVKPDRISDEGITLINDSNEYISEKARAKARVVPKDSIFVTCIGTIGKIGITSEGQYAFNQQINVIIPNDIVLPKYLAYSLLYSKSRLVAIANAPVVPIINKSQFGDFLVNIEVDKRKQEEMIEKLDKLSGIIERRKSELKELDNLIKARFVEMFGDPIINDRKWHTKQLGEVCTKITDGEHQNPLFTESGIPMVMANNIRKSVGFESCKYISKNDYEKFSRKCKPEKGDILLVSRGATIGRCCINDSDIPFALMGSVILIKNNSQYVISEFLCNWLQNEVIAKEIYTTSSASAQQAIYMKDLNKKLIYIPPLKIQEKFSEFVKQVNKSKVAVQKALDETQTLFDSLMQEYFC